MTYAHHFLLRLLLSVATLGANAQNHFTKVTDANNPATTFANTAATYKGAAWVDLDGDNWPDLFASQRFLFRNTRDGNFAQLPDLDALPLGQGSSGSSWADINNDGFPDYITTGLVSGMYFNKGDHTFSNQTALLPNFSNYAGWDCALADADNNGLLDVLFVHACCTFHPTTPVPCRLFLQKSPGTFEAQTGYEFTDSNAPYTIPTWADYDLDGDMDLFIGTGPGGSPGVDYCYRNLLKENGAFSLQRLTTFPFMEQQDGQVYNFTDYDNDGDLDICLTNYGGAKTRFYRNNNGTYESLSLPFTSQGTYLANVWGDFDNDGDEDVLISTDQTALVRFFRNKGGNSGFNTIKTAGSANGNACGIALADYDNDGDLDFYTNGASAARTLFRNDTLAQGRHWAQFACTGTTSNRSAIGTTLRVKANIGGQPTWQIRQVLAHNSFQGHNDLRQHIGLNDATLLDSVEVRWPSGLVQRFAGLPADRFYRVVEGQPIQAIVSAPEPAPTALPTVLISPSPASAEGFSIQTEARVKSVEIFDSTGRAAAVDIQALGQVHQVRWRNPQPAGLYLVRLHLESGAVVTKEVVKGN